jgi:transcriptional regulator with XRE-family HTH domain
MGTNRFGVNQFVPIGSVAMAIELGTNWYVDVKDRVRELREALGWSQDTLGKRANDSAAKGEKPWHRVQISKIERGDNKLSSVDARARVARAFGMSGAQLAQYLNGGMSVDQAVAIARGSVKDEPRSKATPAAPAETQFETDDPGLPVGAEDATQFELALFKAMASGEFLPEEFDATRSAIREIGFLLKKDIDLDVEARSWLTAARHLRRTGRLLTTAAIAAETSFIKSSPQAKAEAEARDAALNERAAQAARDMGVEPGSGSHVKATILANLARQKKSVRDSEDDE